MSSLALMRWLEGAPERYDAGMRVLSFGRIARLHAAVASAAMASAAVTVVTAHTRLTAACERAFPKSIGCCAAGSRSAR